VNEELIDYGTYILSGFGLASAVYWASVAIQAMFKAFRQAGGEYHGYE
jgi:hypothetical protein